MQKLTAIDAISPAFRRVKLVISAPFRLGHVWKLGASFYISRVSTVFVPVFLCALFFPLVRSSAGGGVAWIFLSFIAACSVVYCVLFYLSTRLQMALFDVLTHVTPLIRPSWRRYGAKAWQLMSAKIALSLSCELIFFGPLGLYAWKVFAPISRLPSGTALPVEYEERFIGVYLCLLAAALLFMLLVMPLLDALVCILALEEIRTSDALRLLWQIVRPEQGAFLAFSFVRLGLLVFGGTAVLFVAEFAALIVMLVLTLAAFLVGAVLHAIGVPSTILQALGTAFALPLVVAFVFGLLPTAIGAFYAVVDAHALYFMAGRYPRLAVLLDAPMPPQYQRITPMQIEQL